MAEVFAFGLAVIDFVFRVDRLPTTGEKYFTQEAYVIGGGCAANAAVAIKKLGGVVTFGTRLGDDFIGDLIIKDLYDHELDVVLINRKESSRSSFSSVAIDPNGERQIINFRGQGLNCRTDWLEEAPHADVYLTDTIWPEGARKILELAKQADIPGIADAESMRTFDSLKAASHVAFSRQGLASITQSDDLTTGLRTAREYLDAWLCVTDGSNGVYYLEGSRIENIPGHSIDAVETLGAGDVWHGAFALRVAEGADEIDAVQFANATSALKCKQAGGRSSFPNRDAVTDLLALHSTSAFNDRGIRP